MHELSIARSVLSIAEKAANGNSATITAVQIQVGELSSIETESLRFAFSVIRDNTPLQNAELDIEIIPGEAKCNSCNTVFPLHAWGEGCPACNSFDLQILKGREMKVLSITVDE